MPFIELEKIEEGKGAGLLVRMGFGLGSAALMAILYIYSPDKGTPHITFCSAHNHT